MMDCQQALRIFSEYGIRPSDHHPDYDAGLQVLTAIGMSLRESIALPADFLSDLTMLAPGLVPPGPGRDRVRAKVDRLRQSSIDAA